MIVRSELASATNANISAQSASTPVGKPLPPGKGDPGMELGVPLAARLRTPTPWTSGIATMRNLPSGVTLMPSGLAGSAKGDPGMGVNAPFPAIWKAATSCEPALVAYRKRLSGVAPSEMPDPAKPPVGKGEPGTIVRAPLTGLIENTVTLSLPSLATNKRFPTTHAVMRFVAKNPPGLPTPPVGYGEPGNGTRAPAPVTEKAETALGPEGSLLT